MSFASETKTDSLNAASASALPSGQVRKMPTPHAKRPKRTATNLVPSKTARNTRRAMRLERANSQEA